MKLAVTMNAHGNTDLVVDTVEAIKQYVTDDVLVVIDGCSWESWGASVALGAAKLRGFNHGWSRGPYRNMTLGLQQVAQVWPDADWYVYCESDVLFGNDKFKEDLEAAEKEGCWCVGFDLRTEEYKFPLLELMMKDKFECSKYLLGCCVFHHRSFIQKLLSVNFFERFLNLTNDFNKDFFPGFSEQKGYDFGEHLYPTLAHHLGGSVKGLAGWQDQPGIWRGNFRKYPVRFKPELEDNFYEASIMHPVKDYYNEVRQQRRVIRRRKAEWNENTTQRS